MKFKDYHQIKLDEILDKISDSGINSLSKFEIKFLDAFSQDDTIKMISLEYESMSKNFKSTDGYFYFSFSHSKDYGDVGKSYFGVITVPSLSTEDDKIIDGTFDGYIQATLFGNIPFFEKDGYDILDFCDGLEYEFDNFLDYVVDTLNDEKNDL